MFFILYVIFFAVKENDEKKLPKQSLRSLINCSVRPEQLNSGFSGINGYEKQNIQKKYTSIYQPANPSNKSCFVIVSLTLIVHCVMLGSLLVFLKQRFIIILKLQGFGALRNEQTIQVKQYQRECCLKDRRVGKCLLVKSFKFQLKEYIYPRKFRVHSIRLNHRIVQRVE